MPNTSHGSSKTIPHLQRKPKQTNRTKHSGSSLIKRLLAINTDDIQRSSVFFYFVFLSFLYFFFFCFSSIHLFFSSLYLFLKVASVQHKKRYKLKDFCSDKHIIAVIFNYQKRHKYHFNYILRYRLLSIDIGDWLKVRYIEGCMEYYL